MKKPETELYYGRTPLAFTFTLYGFTALLPSADTIDRVDLIDAVSRVNLVKTVTNACFISAYCLCTPGSLNNPRTPLWRTSDGAWVGYTGGSREQGRR